MAFNWNTMQLRFLLSCIVIALCCSASATLAAGTAQSNPNLQKVMRYFDERKYDSAIVCLRQELVKEPSNNKLLYELALAHAMSKQNDSARTILERILPDEQSTDKYYQLLANVYAETDDTVKAREVLLKGSKRFPKSGKMHMELGLLQLQQHHLDEALDEFEEGIQVDPNFYGNYYWAARSYSTGNEKIWTLLYAEVLMNIDPSPTRASVSSSLIYSAHNAVYENFRSSHQMIYSKAQKGSADASQKPEESFETRFNQAMTKGAAELKFFQDFEIPIASIDTMQQVFVKEWYAAGYDKRFPNAAIERHKELMDLGLHRAYTFYLMQFAKPLECKAYLTDHKKEYEKFLSWFKKHPMVINDKNHFSRFLY